MADRREPRIGVDPNPRPVDQIDNLVGPDDVIKGEMPFGPGSGLPLGLNKQALEMMMKRLAPSAMPVAESLAEAAPAAVKLRPPMPPTQVIDKGEQFMKYIRKFIPDAAKIVK